MRRMKTRMHEYERKFLEALSKYGKEKFEKVSEDAGLNPGAANYALAMLEEKGLIKIDSRQKEEVSLAEEGKEYLEKGLPERRVLDSIQGKEENIKNLMKKIPGNEFRIASIWLVRQGLAKIRSGKITLTEKGEEYKSKPTGQEKVLKLLSEGKRIPEELQRDYELLKGRGKIIEVKKAVERTVEITKEGKAALAEKPAEEEIAQLTGSMIVTGSWKGKQFKKYDINAPSPPEYGGRIHPTVRVMRQVRSIFTEMGFHEMKGPWVESAFWCFDSMFVPQDHPAREVQDTFYLDGKAKLPEPELVDRVKKVHENGYDTGSKGYGYEWDPELAMKRVLRTHTTATTFRYFGKGIEKPAKYFSIDRVFRNETVDKTHLAEFHQIEGFVLGDVDFRDLVGYLKTFYKKMGIEKIRLKPYYNPYTEPSTEIFAKHPKLGWIELGNSGQFRPESLAPYGITENVVAWGLGLERLVMLTYNKHNIRDVLGPTCDLQWIRAYSIGREE